MMRSSGFILSPNELRHPGRERKDCDSGTRTAIVGCIQCLATSSSDCEQNTDGQPNRKQRKKTQEQNEISGVQKSYKGSNGRLVRKATGNANKCLLVTMR